MSTLTQYRNLDHLMGWQVPAREQSPSPITSWPARAMCTSKRGYDKRGALSEINRIRASHRRNQPTELRAYPCPYCKRWHLTSQEDES